jgi:hypothetical protein
METVEYNIVWGLKREALRGSTRNVVTTQYDTIGKGVGNGNKQHSQE